MKPKTINQKIYEAVNDPWKIVIALCRRNGFRWLPDKEYINLFYRGVFHERLDLANPRTFNEKLQWLKLYDRQPEYTRLVDKYAVRKYVAETIGEEYLIPLLGVWDKFDEIDFGELPRQFVLKCSHDSGGQVICKDKKKLDIVAARKKINRCLSKNYYYKSREWPYKDVKPRIICEKYMVDESGVELKDYKVFCFSGEAKIIQVDFDRFNEHKRNIYDTEWNYIPLTIKYPTDPSRVIKKPDKLKDLLCMAKLLASDYPHVRVDFYSIKNRVYFGEMTFYHGSGFEKFTPESYDYLFGKWIDILRVSKSQGEYIT